MSDGARLREAAAAFEAGDGDGARALLKALTEADPDDELAWLWYAYVQDGVERQIAVLQSYLARHPESAEARKYLAVYQQRATASAEAQPADDGGGPEAASGLAAWQAAAPIADKLALARQELLDLSNRNPLLNYRLLIARGVALSEPEPDRVLSWLLGNGKRPLSFLPRPEPEGPSDGEDGDAALPALEGAADEEASTRRLRALQTVHSAKELDKRLLATYYAARTYIEEQGVNVLFLAFGMLVRTEADDAETERLAPLLLVPVEITRTDVRSRFRIHYTEDDIGENLSLREKLRREFSIELPPLPEPDDLDPGAYFAQVAAAVRHRKGWRVEPTALVLGFFSFATFLMYHDLLEESWAGRQEIADHPLLRSLLVDGFSDSQPGLPDDAFLDDLVDPAEAPYVVDADSSQLAALLDVQGGRNLVIQGPPGTGKSQTITNLIAEAVAQGKRVLFVAEKMAALEVVKRRLDAVGLGAACLELHSHKSNKRAVLGELARTLHLGRPSPDDGQADLRLLVRHRDALNAHSRAVNTPIGASDVTPYQCYGYLPAQAAALDGSDPPEVAFAPMASWTSERYRAHRSLVGELQALIARIGVPTAHPFWGCDPPNVTPSSRRTFLAACEGARIAVEGVQGAARALTQHLGIPEVGDRAGCECLQALAQRLAQAPDLTGIDVANAAWRTQRDHVASALSAAERLAELHARYDHVLTPEAWTAEVGAIRTAYDLYRTTWWRLLIADFREARAALAGLVAGKLPRGVAARMALLDAIEAHRRLSGEVAAWTPLLTTLFGDAWRGSASDWATLQALTDRLHDLHRDLQQGRLPQALLDYVAGSPDRAFLQAGSLMLEEALVAHGEALDGVIGEVRLEEEARFGAPGVLSGYPFAEQRALLAGWVADVDRLQEMVVYHHYARALSDADLGELAGAAAAWPGAAGALVALYDRTWYEGLLGLAIDTRPELALFDTETQGRRVEAFRRLDRLQFRYHQVRLAELHWQRLPNPTASSGQMAVLLHEMQKKRRHYPIRKLMQLAGNAVQGLKPVLMMSPLSVAMYLPPGSVQFDLVVFDEASQVKPADALGAILRGEQIVVTGDSKQLPPTNFFESIAEREDDEEENLTADVESVLGLLSAQGAPQRMLNWHYRSRHASLIAVSNHEFYDNRLVVFPSPDDAATDTGLILHHLPDAAYDRGGSRANRDEARCVAEAVMAHARSRPDLTLGVAAFSVSQMNEIQAQVERLRRQDPSCEPYFNAHPHEPFFVKNLENVQGDERDVIFVSVGYGRSADGHLTMAFGPLNREGGERRLNVLITRARSRCEVFSSLTADDIDLSRTRARGVVALKRFLHYAEARNLDVPTVSGRPSGSPFEEDVAKVLRSYGYTVDPQVGSAGFFIDLAVKDEAHPGRYLIGIECDGAGYHSARSARDRDRLRQEVLEGLGWRMYRIWSTDWFNRREQELARLVAAVEAAREQAADPPPAKAPAPLPAAPEGGGVARAAPRERAAAEAAPYVPVRLRIRTSTPPHEIRQRALEGLHAHTTIRTSTPLHEIPLPQLAGWVVKVVEGEGPLHTEVLTRRIAHAAGAGRTGSRIRAAVLAGVQHAEGQGKVQRRGDFVWPPGMAEPPVRDRAQLPAAERKLELIAPEELRRAVLSVVREGMGMLPEEVPGAACRLLGFGRTSAEMDAVVDALVQEALQSGALVARGDFLVCEA